MQFRHKRGRKSMGHAVDLKFTKQPWGRPHVNGLGNFSIPDDAPTMVIEFLEKCGHLRLDPDTMQPINAPMPRAKPTKERPPRAVKADTVKEPEAVEIVDKYPWYPGELRKIHGVGKGTIKRIFAQFPEPELILSHTGHVRGLNERNWTAIQDFITSKLQHKNLEE